jgi:hypothetical protein
MALQAVPFALQSASHSAALFRQSASAVFVQGGIIAAGEFAVTQNSTPGMSVFVGAGRAKVTGTSATAPSGFTWTTQGMYDVLNDATATVTITSADATNPRIDVVYVAINDAYYTGSTNSAALVVAAGTPAVSPVVPTIPANAMALAQVRVNANATQILNTNITDVRTYASIMGQVKVYNTKTLLLAVTGMKLNDVAAVVADSTATNNAFYYYNGSAWVQITSTTFDASAIVSGTFNIARIPTITPAYGGTGATSLTGYVYGNGTSTMTASTTIPVGSLSGTLPVANGGTGLSSMTAGLLRYNGSVLLSGQTVAATDIPASEQAQIISGGFYSGGVTSGSVVNVFVQSAQPSSGVTAGDLWFW